MLQTNQVCYLVECRARLFISLDTASVYSIMTYETTTMDIGKNRTRTTNETKKVPNPMPQLNVTGEKLYLRKFTFSVNQQALDLLGY